MSKFGQHGPMLRPGQVGPQCSIWSGQKQTTRGCGGGCLRWRCTSTGSLAFPPSRLPHFRPFLESHPFQPRQRSPCYGRVFAWNTLSTGQSARWLHGDASMIDDNNSDMLPATDTTPSLHILVRSLLSMYNCTRPAPQAEERATSYDAGEKRVNRVPTSHLQVPANPAQAQINAG